MRELNVPCSSGTASVGISQHTSDSFTPSCCAATMDGVIPLSSGLFTSAPASILGKKHQNFTGVRFRIPDEKNGLEFNTPSLKALIQVRALKNEEMLVPSKQYSFTPSGNRLATLRIQSLHVFTPLRNLVPYNP